MDAAEIQRIKDLLPTSFGTDEIRARYARAILERAVFSAKMESAKYLARVREICAQILEGRINQATARAELLKELEAMGHSPLDGGGITNPASIRRLNLVVDTQRAMAANVAKIAGQTEETVAKWPAWELTRARGRRVPRDDWDRRWRAAGESCGWAGAVRGEMVALKRSPIWQALGNGAGGFRDTLGNPYPPFAFGSGLGWLQVPRARCAELGLVSDDEETELPESPTLTPFESDVAEAAERLGFTAEDFA